MTMTDEQSCGTCRYWRENSPGYSEGSCKRYPPQPDLLQLAADIRTYRFSSDKCASEGAFYWSQPCTAREDWCGEWRGKQFWIGNLIEPQPDAPS